MKFDQVYNLLGDYESRTNGWYLVLREPTLRQIYQQILANNAKDCLELGTAWGATTCVMAAAVEELGNGMVTTVDKIARQPVGVSELIQVTGLARYVNPVVHEVGYNWFLLEVLREQIKDNVCDPCYDFCFLDGAHFWETDALATLLVTKLLRPGAWLMMDDLHWRARGAHPGWAQDFADMSEQEKDTAGVGMVFDLLVKTHPELSQFTLTNEGHIGWARKIGGPSAIWQPRGVIAGSGTGSWIRSVDGATATRGMVHGVGLSIEERDGDALLRATVDDPNVQLVVPNEPPRPADYVTLRVKLLSPYLEFVQLYWLGLDGVFFDEALSMRCIVRAQAEPQDLTFPIPGTARERTLKALRLDPGMGPCELLLVSVTLGGK